MTTADAPVVVTLRWDAETHARLTRYRTTYFPKHANHLSAHLTLFHAIPAADFFGPHGQGERALRQLCGKQKRFGVSYGEPTLKGRVVFLRLFANPLVALHQHLLDLFNGGAQSSSSSTSSSSVTETEQKTPIVRLTEQDKRRLHPHITVCNKGSAEEAQRAFDALLQDFIQETHDTAPRQAAHAKAEGTAASDDTTKSKHRRFRGHAEGIDIWRYRGGPWEHCFTIPFREPQQPVPPPSVAS